MTILQTHGARPYVYGRLAATLAGVPVVISTIHNSLKHYDISGFTRRLYQSVLNQILPSADRIICVADALRQDLLKECPAVAGKAVVVHNGVTIEKYRPSADGTRIRREFGISSGPLLVAVGRLTEQKGHRYLLQALPAVLETWPQLRCLIVGDGELRECLQSLTEQLGVARACIFAGVRGDIPDILASADIVVLPSVSEGFPFVSLEALAMSRAVVATAVSGVPELITDRQTGRLVPSKNPGALARVLDELLRDRAGREAMGQMGNRLVRERFTAERMVAETMAVFEGALRERGRSSVTTTRAVA